MEPPRITPNMRIRDILSMHPNTLPVLRRHGILCGGCHASRYESLGQGARVHSLDLDHLLAELNRAARGAASLPTTHARTLPPT